MKEEDFKIAELPGGKFLKFSPNASEKEMQRAVRKELGIINQGEQLLMEQMDDLIDRVGTQERLHREQIEQVSDALSANGSRISGEMSDAIREVRQVVRSMDESLRKVTANQISIVSRLQATIDQLNKTMDHAVGETVGMMGDSHRVAGGIENGMRDMNALVGALMHTVKEVSNLKNVRRRARRNRDGSYTFESEDFD